jgi:hypothetical protein
MSTVIRYNVTVVSIYDIYVTNGRTRRVSGHGYLVVSHLR